MPTGRIADFFASLGAPLKNVRWSWGAERRDGVIFLRAWEHDRESDDSGDYVVIAHATQLEGGAGAAGWAERWHHIERIRAGARCFVVMCVAKDVEATPRQIESFDARQLVIGGQLEVKNGWTYLEIAGYCSPMTLIDRSRLGR